MERPTRAESPRGERSVVQLGLRLAVVAGLSLGLLSWIDRPLHAWLSRAWPGLAIVPDLRLSSLAVCALLLLASGARGSLGLPREVPWRSLAIVYLIWLLPAAYFVLVARVWVPALPRVEDLVAFLGTGLLAEELLFRGAVYQRALDLFGERRIARLPAPVLVSALCFGASHLQYHGFRFTAPALTQVGYTSVMGVFLGLPRSLTGSLWPCVALHLLNNALVLLR